MNKADQTKPPNKQRKKPTKKIRKRNKEKEQTSIRSHQGTEKNKITVTQIYF